MLHNIKRAVKLSRNEALRGSNSELSWLSLGQARQDPDNFLPLSCNIRTRKLTVEHVHLVFIRNFVNKAINVKRDQPFENR